MGRFAAKEATIKAISSRSLSWHEVRIYDGTLKPYVTVMPTHSSCRERVGSLELHQVDRTTAEGEAQVARLSISHDGDYAIAIVMAVDSFDESSPKDTKRGG